MFSSVTVRRAELSFRLFLLLWALTANDRLLGQEPIFSGVWVLDATRKDARDVYGELRLVSQTTDSVHVTMIDYGTAWIGDQFRPVVRVLPWTYRFGIWGPRRGGPTSSQPTTRARKDGDRLVLVKSPGESYGHVWVWTLGADGTEILQTETAQSWNADFNARPPEGGRTYHVRAPRDESGAFLHEAPGFVQAIPEVQEVVVRVSADLRNLLVTCPSHACMVVRLESGVRRDSIPLPMGETTSIRLPSEVVIQPVPR